MKFLMGPAPCKACGTLVYLFQKRDRSVIWKQVDGKDHRCRA